MFKIIACTNLKNALGKNNSLIYNIKADLMNFKRMTTDNVVIMGRKTFESLPKGALPNRVNIVITTNPNFYADNCIICASIEEATEICYRDFTDKDWYVIGGAIMYEEFLKRDLIDTIYLTTVIDTAEGDVYFPNFNENGKFKLFYQSEPQINKPPYTFEVYKLQN